MKTHRIFFLFFFLVRVSWMNERMSEKANEASVYLFRFFWCAFNRALSLYICWNFALSDVIGAYVLVWNNNKEKKNIKRSVKTKNWERDKRQQNEKTTSEWQANVDFGGLSVERRFHFDYDIAVESSRLFVDELDNLSRWDSYLSLEKSLYL